MILTAHLLAGAVVGAKIQNLWLIFILGFVSHFLIDRLPHWDYDGDNIENEIKNKLLFFSTKALIDLSIGLIFLWLIFGRTPLAIPVFLGAIAGALPDFLIGLDLLQKRFFKTSWPLLEKFKLISIKNHSRRKVNFNFLNIFCEITIIVLSLIILLT